MQASTRLISNAYTAIKFKKKKCTVIDTIKQTAQSCSMLAMAC